jgi:protein TonB
MPATPDEPAGQDSAAAERSRPRRERPAPPAPEAARPGPRPSVAEAEEEPVERAVRVGGTIRPPTKIRDVRPNYPQVAQSARVQGMVIIEATIDREGRVADARMLRSIPLLDQAALDAVRQWRYEPTLLNGVAVPVIMTVTVNFTLRP